MKTLGLILMSPFISVFSTAILVEIVEKLSGSKWDRETVKGCWFFMTLFVAGLLLILFS